PAAQVPLDLTTDYYRPRGDSAFSLDGARVAGASRSDPRVVKVWDVATGRELRGLQCHAAPISSVAFSPDGRTIVSAAWDRAAERPACEIKVWDVASSRSVRSWNTTTSRVVIQMAFSPDGAVLASANGDGTVSLWQVADGREQRTLARHQGVA